MAIQVDALLSGVAAGNFTPKPGSQFGSIWQLDGLLTKEATPDEYAAFGAARNEKVGVGEPVSWLGRTWSTILVYDRSELRRVNIQTDIDDGLFAAVQSRLEALLGNAQDIRSAQDAVLSVERRLGWLGQAGAVFLIRTPTYLQVVIGPKEIPSTSAGCLGSFLLIASGLSVAVWSRLT